MRDRVIIRFSERQQKRKVKRADAKVQRNNGRRMERIMIFGRKMVGLRIFIEDCQAG
jgi:hypothetical protein